MLNIDIWNIAFTVINILVLYFFLKHFLFRPVQKIMDERKQMVEQDLDAAQNAKGNVTATLAVMSIILVEVAGVQKKGVKGWLKSFAEPVPIVLPINVLELVIRPLSLALRLFGNVLGAIVVMALVKYVAPLIVPLPLSFYFDIFDGVIQAYVFVFLTSLYIKEAIE